MRIERKKKRQMVLRQEDGMEKNRHGRQYRPEPLRIKEKGKALEKTAEKKK